jgi:large subunit ribosomal protein L25
MTAVKQIEASARAQVGKGAARAVRRQGLTPAVIYGGGAAPEAIALDANKTRLLIYGGHFLTTLFEVSVDGKKTRVIPRDYQLDPVKDFPIHIDFLRVARARPSRSRFRSTSSARTPAPASRLAALMQIIEHALEIDVEPENIPEFLRDLGRRAEHRRFAPCRCDQAPGRREADSVENADATIVASVCATRRPSGRRGRRCQARRLSPFPAERHAWRRACLGQFIETAGLH